MKGRIQKLIGTGGIHHMKNHSYLEYFNVIHGVFDVVEVGAERCGIVSLVNFLTRIHLHSGH